MGRVAESKRGAAGMSFDIVTRRGGNYISVRLAARPSAAGQQTVVGTLPFRVNHSMTAQNPAASPSPDPSLLMDDWTALLRAVTSKLRSLAVDPQPTLDSVSPQEVAAALRGGLLEYVAALEQVLLLTDQVRVMALNGIRAADGAPESPRCAAGCHGVVASMPASM